MTTDTKLLPLPWSDVQPNGRRWLFKPEDRPRVEDYARACVEHAAASLQAEIEALRVDVEAWKASHSMLTDTCHHFQAQAKRLAEALRHQRWCRTCAEDGWESCEEGRKNDALLRDQEDGK